MRVNLHQLTKRFTGVTAVDSISLEITEGELLALVGPSGCGKTTTLRMIAGLEAPDAGDIRFDEESVLGRAPEERGVGLVFQNYALFPHMNVFENIAYGLKFTREQIDRTVRVAELLALVGLEGLEKRRPSELSAGQQQRVALARALAPKPKILLLDEPLSALDAKLREKLRVEIRQLQRALKITTLYVTHDQEEALAISDRVAVMNAGRIEQVDTPQKLYRQPTTEFVARFIGRGNLIEATLVRIDENILHMRLADQQELSLLQCPKRLLQVGETVRLLIRPERIRLGDESKIQLKGRWRGTEFLGDALLGHIECGGQEWIVKLDADLDLPKEGSSVIFSFSPSDCVLF